MRPRIRIMEKLQEIHLLSVLLEHLIYNSNQKIVATREVIFRKYFKTTQRDRNGKDYNAQW